MAHARRVLTSQRVGTPGCAHNQVAVTAHAATAPDGRRLPSGLFRGYIRDEIFVTKCRSAGEEGRRSRLCLSGGPGDNRAAMEGLAMDGRVAILGTGRMGSAIAQRLAQAGAEISLWNRTPSRAAELAGRLGVGSAAGSPAEAVGGADLVISSLTGPEAVRSAFGGPNGAVAGAHGQVFVEMSTAGPDVVRELEPALAAHGSALLDAPIMGPPTAVLRGEAAVLVGGPVAAVEMARPTLAHLGDVRHVGAAGNGARLKLVANSMLGAVILAAAELQSAGEATGLDPEDVFWVSARLCPVLNARREGYLRGTHTPTLFAVRDLVKDLGLALTLFHQSGSTAPLIGLTRELIGEVGAVSPDLDISAVAGRYPRRGANLL